ncbi:MFS transporter [Actinokineospora soli]|uniref:MFS transporter n=1 Tax=Actinokineospora soli TaxID=1048753 RepID=A0ABW2TJV1_9PSEU
MYVSGTALPDAARSAGPVPPTVLALGLVSLFTDVSAEMVSAFLPMYLVYGLGVGYLQLGVLDALYTGATAVLRLAGGHVADRTGRPKAVAAVGYGLSAVTKLGFPAAGGSLGAIGGLIAADRAGKGIRTGPRDALITLSTPESGLGRAFGVHRAMDTFGALLGPVVVFALLAWTAATYDAVFVVAFCSAAVGLVILLCWVRERPRPPGRPRVRLREGLALLRERRFRGLTVVALALGATTVSDAFLLLAVQRQADWSPDLLPLLPVGVAAVFLAASIPVGKLADRVGRVRVFIAGHVLLLGAYVLLATGAGWPVAVLALALHGLYYASTDGVLMACAGPLVPEHLRASGLAVVQTAHALGRTAAALLFGAVAAAWDPRAALVVFAVALAAAAGWGARWR